MEELSVKTAKKLLANVKWGQGRNKHRKSLGSSGLRVEEMQITSGDIIQQFNKQNGLCYYSGLPMNEEYNHISRHPFAISVERLDNKKGYVLDNIKLTRRLFNLGRGSYTGDFHKLMKTLLFESYFILPTQKLKSFLQGSILKKHP
jgi:hypothetical protein